MLIQIIFQFLNEASSVFFMVVLMQLLSSKLIFLPLLITRLMLAIYLFLIVDIMIMNFFLFESSGFEFKVVLKII